MQQKKLFLLDGMALIYRAFFAFSQNPRITSYGLNSSAMFGFTNTLIDLLNREKPTHIAVVFDTDAPTQRHVDFESYKAHRQEMPEDLSKSVPYIFRIIEGFNIPVITLDGYEADDIIGTLACKAEKKGYHTYMMTPDKDFGQLVTDSIFIYKPGRSGGEFEIMGVQEILKKWEIRDVKQVIDILGLWGDAVDNIPGIPGFGEKTAKQLIAQYGSIENLIEHAHELKGKQREKVETFREQALLSKKLATIICDAPIELDEESLAYNGVDAEKLKEVFNELEFRTMGRRVFGDGPAVVSTAPSQPGLFDAVPEQHAAGAVEEAPVTKVLRTINEVEHEYQLVSNNEDLRSVVAELLQQTEISFDTETTSTDGITAELVGMSFAYKAQHAWYIPFPSEREAALEKVEIVRPLLENGTIIKTGQNIKYDMLVLQNYGLQVKGPFFDTMLAHYLIEPDQRHGMDVLAEKYLAYSPVSITTLIGKKGGGQLSMRNVELEKIKEYAAEDADITLQLGSKLKPEIDNGRIKEVYHNIEIPLIEVLAAMEREGIRIDVQNLNDYSQSLQGEIVQLEKDIYELSGETFNISSPRQLGEVLFEKLKLDPNARRTKTGQYQTGEDVLTALKDKHPVIGKILDIRQFQKLKSTYVDSLPTLVNPATGRVHTSFNQAVAATGRLSSNNPNLQNIPIRTEKGREVRKAFVARDSGHVLLSADYSQIELRIVASISQDPNMIDAFNSGMDIHTATAAKVYGIPASEVDSTQRRNAKAVNFGIIYGQSAFGLSQSLGIPRKEAAAIIEEYFRQYPGIKKYMDDSINLARETGYVETLMGRRRYLRDINSRNFTVRGFAERNAINAPIQGSAADMIKLAMIRIHDRLKKEGLQSRMILQVHDELLFDVPHAETDQLRELVKEEMVNAMPLNVPVVVEAGIGNNWLEAH